MRKPLLTLIGALGLGALVALGAILWIKPADGEEFKTPKAGSEDLEAVAESRVYFAHKSVGYNVMDALPGVFEDAGVAVPAIVESTVPPVGPVFLHAENGENGDPLGKIDRFDEVMRAGLAEDIDVAVLKLCYVDFRRGEVDVDKVFTAYHDTMTALQRDFPDVAFVAATSPLTAQRGPKARVNAAIGRADRYGPEHNVEREEFNALIRAEYSEPGALFDIAAIQSTTPDGDRVAYEQDGNVYYAMNKAYASDPGHLNADGGAVAASAFLAVIASALD